MQKDKGLVAVHVAHRLCRMCAEFQLEGYPVHLNRQG